MAMLSSPLAAMAPPPCPPNWVFGKDVDETRSRASGTGSFGRSTKFTFEGSSLGKKSGVGAQDYFTKTAPIRGSSPTASLAADLSQNFFIEQSPQLPTPRRSLFTSGIFAKMAQPEGAITPPILVESGTTPVPSSSPCGISDSMDYSPLPHKPAFSLAPKDVASPTPKINDDDIKPMDNVSSENKFPSFERRRSNVLRRPSLSRTKCQSTSFLSKTGHNLLPPFTFGAGGNGSNSSHLDQCFTASPQAARQSEVIPAPIQNRPRMGSMHSFEGKETGSPSQSKKVGQMGRPRKIFRRTLSMYEHPRDVIRPEKCDTALDSIMDVDEAYELKLPNFIPDDKPDSLPRINQDTMIAVLSGEFNHLFANTMVIDCRFEYEYNGGHIDGATNFNDKEHLARHLFEPLPTGDLTTLIILHCEYSAHRAPLMAKYLRQQDRAVNAARYPQLTYPEVYILDGGYSSFFKNHRSKCFPQSYVEMESRGNELACERGLNKIRIGQRGKLSRAQTYAFGQKLQFKSSEKDTGIAEESSPCRLPTSTQDYVTWGVEEAPGKMSMTKRTVSY